MSQEGNDWQEKVTNIVGKHLERRQARYSKRRKMSSVSMVVFILVGFAILAFGIVLLINTTRFMNNARTTTAEVIEVSRYTNSDGYLEFVPVLEYENYKGEVNSFEWLSETHPTYEVGDEVEILYDPEDPTSVKIDRFADTWLLPIAVLGMGFFWMFMSVMMGIVPVLKRRKIQAKLANGEMTEQEYELTRAASASKVSLILGIIFTLVGGGLFTGGMFTLINTRQFLEKAVNTNGTVISMQEHWDSDSSSYTYSPVIEFYTDNDRPVIFSSDASSSNPKYSVGEMVPVLYDPDSPQKARIDTEFEVWGKTKVLLAFGGLFFIVGFLMLFIPFIRNMRHKWLIKNGMSVDATVVSCPMNTNVSVSSTSTGRMHPYRIIAEWKNPRTGDFVEFKSQDIWFDPDPYVGETVRVYVHPENPKNYYLDTTFLPKKEK